MKLKALVLVTAFSGTAAMAAAPQLAFEGTFQGAYAYPEGDMEAYFLDGRGGRLKLFAGIKLPIKAINAAAGLGIDLTYLQFQGKDSRDLYEIYQWDWLVIPYGVRIGVIELSISAGAFWNVIKLNIAQFDYGQTSIRPGFYGDVGLGIFLIKNLGLTTRARYGWMFEDRERLEAGNNAMITMDYLTLYAGLTLRF